MSRVLVNVEVGPDGRLARSTAALVGAGARLGEVEVLVCDASGPHRETVRQLGDLGVRRIHHRVVAADDRRYLAPQVEALTRLVRDDPPTAVLLSDSPVGREIAGRLSVRLPAAAACDVVDLRAEDGRVVAVHSVFGGEYVVESTGTAGPLLVTVRSGAFQAPAPAERAGTEVEVLSEAAPSPQGIGGRAEAVMTGEAARASGRWARVEEITPVSAQTGRPDLVTASRVVSGGRGLGAKENFALVEELADALGAAVGASRAAVDAGWTPPATQIGQTGVAVSPDLYLALGISGAIQHRAGMQTARTIVAVDIDENAPIFDIADLGVVGDALEVAPALAAALRAREANGNGQGAERTGRGDDDS